MATNPREFAIEVVTRLKRAGFEAFWAGGCVRDFLLGLEPEDFDVATSAQPHQIRELFGKSYTLPVGAAFGVVIVLDSSRHTQVEVATFRTDCSYSDGRRPDSVVFSTPEMDAQRRDFTINGMFYDPLASRVIDYVGGQDDLKNSIVRAIGNAHDRIREDKLRMLRAVRIAARFEFAIEEETYRVIRQHALEAASVSGERMAVELKKTLQSKAVVWAVRAWADTGLMQVLLPEVADAWNEGDCADQIQRMLCYPKATTWLARLGCLIWAAGRENADVIVDRLKNRLKLSNDHASALKFALQHQNLLGMAERLSWSEVQPCLTSQWIDTAVELLELRTQIGQARMSTVGWLRERLDWPAERLNPPALLTGSDLIQAGYQPDARFKDWLTLVRRRQLDGLLTTKEQSLEFLEAQRP